MYWNIHLIEQIFGFYIKYASAFFNNFEGIPAASDRPEFGSYCCTSDFQRRTRNRHAVTKKEEEELKLPDRLEGERERERVSINVCVTLRNGRLDEEEERLLRSSKRSVGSSSDGIGWGKEVVPLQERRFSRAAGEFVTGG